MSATGGSIRELSLEGRNFSVPADTDSPRKVGGSENDVEPNGDGTARLIKIITTAGLDSLAVSCDDARGDQEFVQALADTNDFFTGSITYANGTTWSGALQIVGEVIYNPANTTLTFGLKGATLTQQ